MPIYEYWDDDHGGGFVGLRVVVCVKKAVRQRYYAFRKRGENLPQPEIDYLFQCAKDLEQQWIDEQAGYLRQQARDCKEVRISSPYTTGVRGIKMKYFIDRKHRAGELRSYYSPIFDVSGSNNGNRFHKRFNIMTLRFDVAWRRATEFYAGHKGIVNIEPLLEREPPVEKFLVIYKDLLTRGHDIPKDRLPRELWGRKDVWDYILDTKRARV